MKSSKTDPGFKELEFFLVRSTSSGLILKCYIDTGGGNICPVKWSIGGSEGAILRHVAIEASEHYQTHVAALQKQMDKINAAFDSPETEPCQAIYQIPNMRGFRRCRWSDRSHLCKHMDVTGFEWERESQ